MATQFTLFTSYGGFSIWPIKLWQSFLKGHFPRHRCPKFPSRFSCNTYLARAKWSPFVASVSGTNLYVRVDSDTSVLINFQRTPPDQFHSTFRNISGRHRAPRWTWRTVLFSSSDHTVSSQGTVQKKTYVGNKTGDKFINLDDHGFRCK